MVKRKRINNIKKMIEEHRGLGSGLEYKPWIKIQDVASLGRSTRLKGIKTGRQHEFLSDMERNYFYFLEYSDLVIDIREQYPLLPLQETIAISRELGIEHPKHPKTKKYIVMTTDFLITIENEGEKNNIARTIKSKDELINRRILEKFEIERVYWKRKEINWGIVTDEEINKTFSKNISFFHSYYSIKDFDAFVGIDSKDVEDLILEYIRRIISSDKPIRVISRIFDEDMSLPKGTGIVIFKHLLARKIIKIDLSTEINIDREINVSLKNDILNKELIHHDIRKYGF